MNIVHNCLDKYQHTSRENQAAVIWEGEEGSVQVLEYGQLYRRVNQAANALRSLGLGKGDAIGIFMPMTPEIVIALLSIAKVGGIILPLFSGYGASAVASRLEDAGAKALFTADGYSRRGKPVAMKPVADEAAQLAPSLSHMIVLDRAHLNPAMQPGRDHWWHELVETQPDIAATTTHLRRRYTDGHLYIGNHGSSKGRSAYTLRLSGQSRAGYVFRDRSASW